MKILITFLFLALLISNSYWIYKSVDNAVTISYAADSINGTAKALEQAIRVANLNVIGMDAEEAFDLLNPDVDGLEPFEKRGCISAGQICLVLNDTRSVTGVLYGVNMQLDSS